jgi:hypothetical protein
LDTVIAGLKTAIGLDSSYAAKALTDIEFAKYLSNSQFFGVVTK